MSGEMQEQEGKISKALKGNCSHEKSIQDLEWLGAVGESNEAYEENLPLEQQLGRRGRDSCSTAAGHPAGYLTRVLKHGDDSARIITKLNPWRASSGPRTGEPNRTVQSTVWMYSSHRCCG